MILCPSMMCASYANLEEEVRALEEAGTDIFHCDIMDGSFVPNISMGLMDVKAVRALTKKMVDVPLMIDHPADKIDWFLDAGADLIYIHPESEPQAMKTLMYIRSRGKLSGLAVNPDTSLSAVKELLPHCDYLLIMDGACSPAVIQEYHALSVDGFVLGTSALFHGEGSYVENMNLLRSL